MFNCVALSYIGSPKFFLTNFGKFLNKLSGTRSGKERDGGLVRIIGKGLVRLYEIFKKRKIK